MAVRVYQLADKAFPRGQAKVLVDHLQRRRWWVKAGYQGVREFDPVLVELLQTIVGLRKRIAKLEGQVYAKQTVIDTLNAGIGAQEAK